MESSFLSIRYALGTILQCIAQRRNRDGLIRSIRRERSDGQIDEEISKTGAVVKPSFL